MDRSHRRSTDEAFSRTRWSGRPGGVDTLLQQAVRVATGRGQGRLCEVDARGSARTFTRACGTPMSWYKKTAPAAVTQSARRAGSPTRRASDGRRSIRLVRAKIIAASSQGTVARADAADLPSQPAGPAEPVPIREHLAATAGSGALRG